MARPTRASFLRLSHPDSRLRYTLLTMPLLDEIGIGVLTIATPLLRDRLHLSYAEVGLLFTIASLASLLTEPAIALASDQRDKRLPVLLGLVGLTLGYAMAALASEYLLVALAVILIYLATDSAVGLAQATLMDTFTVDPTQTMARWNLWSVVGDLLAPIATAALGWRIGWAGLCLGVASLWLGACLVLLPLSFPHPISSTESTDEQEPDSSPHGLASLRSILREPLLLRWLGVSVMASLVDDVFLAFVALYLHDTLHISAGLGSLLIGVEVLGALIGSVALTPLLQRIPGPRLLHWLALLALVSLVTLIVAPTPLLAASALFALGFGVSGWYPIASGAIYSAAPGRSGSVRAAFALTGPVDFLMPGLVGLLAGYFGIRAGLAFFVLAPLGVLALTLPSLRSHSTEVCEIGES